MFESLTERLTSSFAGLRGRKELTAENVEEGLREVRQALLEADVHFRVAKDLVEKVRERALGDERIKGVDASEQFVHAFHQELVELMGPEDARIQFASKPPTVILVAGLQGAGKTTTCAKLAKLLKEKHQKRPLLVAADVKRPAAIEQLRVMGERVGVPVHSVEGAAPPLVCTSGVHRAKEEGHDVVILDTAGRLHVDEELMREVGGIAREVKPDAQVLVVDAMTGQDAVQSAESFHSELELTGLILTKLDGDARGGAAVSLKAVTGCPVLFVGTGEKVEDLEPFHPDRMAGRILGMGDVVGLVEKASQEIDEREAQDTYEKMVMGTFTLEDMLAQLRMMRRLGPMKKVLGMMPGIGGMAKDLDIDDKHMNRLEALFTSMTPAERLQPGLLDMSRRRRIARGSGQEVGAVNELLKRFKDMKKLMKQMGKMGMGAKLGAKAKRDALKGMSATGELAGDAGGAGGLGSMLGGGGLGSMLGGGGDMGGMPVPPGGANPFEGNRPMGSSSTRKRPAKRKKKPKRSRKGRKR